MKRRRSREERFPSTSTFTYYNANPKNRITGDCVFRAIATATGKTWEQVVREMAEVSLKTGYAINDKKGIEKYLESIGWTKHRQPRKDDGRKYTGNEFCKAIQEYVYWDNDWDNAKGLNIGDGIIISDKIIANIGGGHLTCIIDGITNDIWDCNDGCIGNYWTKD